MKLVRAEQPAHRVLPADQRLDADHARRWPGRRSAGTAARNCSLVDRLVQRGPHLQPLDHRRVQVAADSAARCPCRRSWPGRGPGRRGAAARWRSSASRLVATPTLAAPLTMWRAAEAVADLDRRAERGDDPGGHVLGAPRRPAVLDQHGELVAAHPGRRVRPRRSISAIRCADRDQQLVADGVPERVVDLLEVVEVDEEHAEGGVVALGGQGERVLQPVAEQHPVGQPGQAVVERLVGQVVLQPPPLGDVPDGQHQRRRRSGRRAGPGPRTRPAAAGRRRRPRSGRRRPGRRGRRGPCASSSDSAGWWVSAIEPASGVPAQVVRGRRRSRRTGSRTGCGRRRRRSG